MPIFFKHTENFRPKILKIHFTSSKMNKWCERGCFKGASYPIGLRKSVFSISVTFKYKLSWLDDVWCLLDVLKNFGQHLLIFWLCRGNYKNMVKKGPRKGVRNETWGLFLLGIEGWYGDRSSLNTYLLIPHNDKIIVLSRFSNCEKLPILDKDSIHFWKNSGACVLRIWHKIH